MPARDASHPVPEGAQAASDEVTVDDCTTRGVASDTKLSVVRGRSRGVTVLPSAEGRSLQSDPRWTSDAARRADNLLARLVARRRGLPAS
ncbi:MAG TPA: hypothetical protein VFY82_15750, partial [Acidimicrobiales bacterium]|nr:hypothetical protein [Acidimicrobiales bacterium]